MKTHLDYPVWPRFQPLGYLSRIGLSGVFLLLGVGICVFSRDGGERLWGVLLTLLGYHQWVEGLWHYADALAQHCALKPALRLLQMATRLAPWRADLWQSLGNLQADLDNWPAATHAYTQALKHSPHLIEALNGLGFAELRQGDAAQAHAYFKQAYQIRHSAPAVVSPEPMSRFKLQHEWEQWQWLLAQNRLPREFETHCTVLAQALAQLKAAPPLPDFVALPTALNTVWCRDLCREEPQAPPGQPCLAPLPATVLSEAHKYAPDQLPPLFWDGFLSPETLSALQAFCLNSTIWHDASRKAGYLASTLDDGFSCPLLYQIAAELRKALPDLFADCPLVYMWAFKCDSEGQGIALHNDSAFLNLNFWITPDTANLDADRGGLVIYPQAPPQAWDFEQIRIDAQGIEQWLAAHPQTPVRIPYRCNRAVLFRSRLFHASDRYQFKPGYENRRINITLLFGKKTLKYYPRPTLCFE